MEKKEAMKILKDFHDKSALFSVRTALDTVIPELKESEDDKIRKELIEHIKANKEADYVLFKKFSPDDVIVWLEKQGEPIDENRLAKGVLNGVAISIMQWLDANCAEGNMCLSNMECADIENAVRNADWQKVYGYMKKKLEKRGEQILANSAKTCKDEQKPADKVEPKFKVGDWVILTAGELSTTLQIVNVDTNKKLYWFNDSSYLPIVDEECLHTWSITEAKAGDVLAGSKGDVILIFKGIGNTVWDDVIDYHCYYDCYRKAFIVQEDVEYWGNIKNNQLKPATKEQRDTLMKKMADAGWEFDFNKKELKKIIEEVNDEDYGIDSLFHAQRILEKTLGKVEGYQSDDGILDHKAAITAIKKLYAQKHAWGEEDEAL